MEANDVVRMANQIAQFFSVYPDEDAVEGVRDHLEKFWPPSMRKDLMATATGLAPSAVSLHPLVLKAAEHLRSGGPE